MSDRQIPITKFQILPPQLRILHVETVKNAKERSLELEAYASSLGRGKICTFTVVYNLFECLEQITIKLYDVIVLHDQTEGLSVYDAMKKIKNILSHQPSFGHTSSQSNFSSPPTRQIPVMLISHPSSEPLNFILAKCRQVGFTNVLRAPYSMDDYFFAINNMAMMSAQDVMASFDPIAIRNDNSTNGNCRNGNENYSPPSSRTHHQYSPPQSPSHHQINTSSSYSAVSSISGTAASASTSPYPSSYFPPHGYPAHSHPHPAHGHAQAIDPNSYYGYTLPASLEDPHFYPHPSYPSSPSSTSCHGTSHGSSSSANTLPPSYHSYSFPHGASFLYPPPHDSPHHHPYHQPQHFPYPLPPPYGQQPLPYYYPPPHHYLPHPHSYPPQPKPQSSNEQRNREREGSGTFFSHLPPPRSPAAPPLSSFSAAAAPGTVSFSSGQYIDPYLIAAAVTSSPTSASPSYRHSLDGGGLHDDQSHFQQDQDQGEDEVGDDEFQEDEDQPQDEEGQEGDDES